MNVIFAIVVVLVAFQCCVQLVDCRGSFGLLVGSSMAVHKAKSAVPTSTSSSSDSNSSKVKKLKAAKKDKKHSKSSDTATSSTSDSTKKSKKNKGTTTSAAQQQQKSIRVATVELSDEERATLVQRQQMFVTVQQLLLSLVSMYSSRQIFKMDYSAPGNILLARIIFTAYILFSQLLGWFLKMRIEKSDDDTVLHTAAANAAAAGTGDALSGFMGKLAAAAGGGSNADSPKDLTVKEHDLKAAAELNRSNLFEIIAAVYLHFTSNYKFMLMLPMMGLMSKLKNPIVMLHVYGLKSVGDLERPFKNPMQKMMEGMSKQQAEASTTTDDDAIATANTAIDTAATTTEDEEEEEDEMFAKKQSKASTKKADRSIKATASKVAAASPVASSNKQTTPVALESVDDDEEEVSEAASYFYDTDVEGDASNYEDTEVNDEVTDKETDAFLSDDDDEDDNEQEVEEEEGTLDDNYLESAADEEDVDADEEVAPLKESREDEEFSYDDDLVDTDVDEQREEEEDGEGDSTYEDEDEDEEEYDDEDEGEDDPEQELMEAIRKLSETLDDDVEVD